MLRNLARTIAATCLLALPHAVADEAPSLPPGVVIDTSPDFQRVYIGCPSIAVSRTAWDGSHNFHDANYFTFHRVEGFRKSLRKETEQE